MRGLLLLGTDTGVGKTTFASGLLHLAHLRGLRLVPYKPAETGCDPAPQDATALLHAATFCDCDNATSNPAHPDLTALLALGLRDVCPYQFRPPIAPSVAARLAGVTISPRALQQQAERLRARGDALLVEAAGGVLTPFGPELTGASLATLLDLDVLLVAANRLGTINHTALAVSEIQRRGLTLRGIVLVDVATEAQPDHTTNATEIAALTGLTPLGTLRNVAGPRGPATLAERVSIDLDLRPLFDGRLVSAR